MYCVLEADALVHIGMSIASIGGEQPVESLDTIL